MSQEQAKEQGERAITTRSPRYLEARIAPEWASGLVRFQNVRPLGAFMFQSGRNRAAVTDSDPSPCHPAESDRVPR